jgi:3-methylcrotonyl-CoA carboxylase alpha subunit
MIGSLLIANRGEIACRIIRTARQLGVRTVAVYSDADAKALHVRQADEAVPIGPSAARESYLVGEKIIAAARQTGAEAIHPGYGFLSENAEFAEAVIAAGLVWVGPRPDSIRAMGLKDAAKKLMVEAGVPVTPGYLGEDQAPERLQAEADAIGYPVLIKAVAGGGGKGMRRVNSSNEFAEMLLSCKREAASSFGDVRVLIEKYIERPRHIEVQVFGDTHGNAVHLFERDCSLQRRHQKVIEEAPAPGMDEVTRAAVCDAAVKAAKAVDYVGAGTIEFIADASEGLRPDRIWFMEMNTRLQVEHPVTEEITRQDLVEWQLRVASGEKLPLMQAALSINGWAMEARLYAEDPANGFLPVAGPIREMNVKSSGWVRIDSGVEAGDEVSPYYDPMIAKVIARGDNREEAREALLYELEQVTTWPLRNNAGFLYRLAGQPDFASGEVHTGFIPDRIDDLIAPEEPPAELVDAAATSLASRSADSLPNMAHAGMVAAGPWAWLSGFRLNAELELNVIMTDGEHTYVGRAGGEHPAVSHWTRGEGVLTVHHGITRYFTLYRPGASGAGGAAGDGAIISPMPGKIIAVAVAAGDTVTKGQKLLTLEAMKMEHSLTAPFDGIVAELEATEGAQVSEGAVLARIEKGEA